MALFVLGDTHLSLGGAKPMDVFPGWNGYVEKLEANWRKLVKPEDTVVLAGDISWSMRLADTRKDFAFLNGLPGQKLIMKGNHDYWWSTANKMNAFFRAEGVRIPCACCTTTPIRWTATLCAGRGGGCSTRTNPTTKR